MRSAELFQRCEDIILFLGATIPVISDTPSALAQSIPCHPPDEGITLVKVFGGNDTSLATVLKASLTVRRYVVIISTS